MKESSLRATLTNHAKHHVKAHVSNIEDRTGTGFPDTTLNTSYGSVFFELKVVKKQSRYARLQTGRLRPNQKQWLKDATKAGATVWILVHFVETGTTAVIHGSRAEEYNNRPYGDVLLLATRAYRGPVNWEQFFDITVRGRHD